MGLKVPLGNGPTGRPRPAAGRFIFLHVHVLAQESLEDGFGNFLRVTSKSPSFATEKEKSNNRLLFIRDLRKIHPHLSGKAYLILVYSLPIVAITSYCKPSGLKQHTFIIVQF